MEGTAPTSAHLGEAGAGSSSVPPEFLDSLCRAYAELLRRQRSASSPFVSWSGITSRAHEFAWLGGEVPHEELIISGRSIRVAREAALFEALQRMHGTTQLNPYEREVMYGYPYVIGRRGGKSIRGPLLTIPVEVEPQGSGFHVKPGDEVVRFNSLPFRPEHESPVYEQAVARVIESTPQFPVDDPSLRAFVDVLSREFPSVQMSARLDGSLDAPPQEPRNGEFISLIDQAALFVAPKGSYFLTSDLESIAKSGEMEIGALAPLIAGAGADESVDLSLEDIDGGEVFYPFPSNRSQRRVALLVDDPHTRLIRVEGPPGTGKSLTIANLACHLAATGRTVLITSQKDKALQVVDELLAGLDLPELPMTLLRHDRESKKDLLNRIDKIHKRRASTEVEAVHAASAERHALARSDQLDTLGRYEDAVVAEADLERAHRSWQGASGLRRLARRVGFWRTTSRARRRAPTSTDEIGARAAARRGAVQQAALQVLGVGAELGIARAKRDERQRLRELAALLRRDQRKYKNFSIFDRLKTHPEWAEGLLKLLPVWILAPDDVARLFPAKAGLFEVVIVDEASQVDLPSITPVLFRGKKGAFFGDTKQMQPRRFAFVAQQVAQQAWRQFDMERHDPDGWLDPMKQSLLRLAEVRAEEENLLDEHFRSLPPIIQFSNERWYEGRLRIMTDQKRKRFGGPAQPIIQLHYVEDGEISNQSQENEREANALVSLLGELVENPDYAEASIGVICLFEEQVALVQDLVTQRIEPKEWEEHDLVVVNPDGFQGDERDVILYSLSWDDKVMPRSALSARQQESEHVQGMLNVGFTRGRDELHIFHSAPVDSFTKADGSPGAITDWLRHCASVEEMPRARPSESRIGRIDSEFEAEVATALRNRGIQVLHQYPACGFNIDIVCDDGSERVAVECDGEYYHSDEHGELRMEDLERQAILERAGWRVVRIPYSKWIKEPNKQLERVLSALGGESPNPDQWRPDSGEPPGKLERDVTKEEKAILEAIREGARDEGAVLRSARGKAGYRRLGKHLKNIFLVAAQTLNHSGLLVIEDGEYFLSPQGRSADFRLVPGGLLEEYQSKKQLGSNRKSRGRSRATRCSCGGRWILRTGRYGRFYGCSRYPRCRQTRPV